MDCRYEKMNGGWECFICGSQKPASQRAPLRNCKPRDEEGRKKLAEIKKRASVPCIHKGKALRLETCSTCCSNFRVFIYSCTVFGECAVDAPTQINIKHKCLSCKKYQSN